MIALKQIMSVAARLFGGIYLLKWLLRRKKVLIVFNYHNFSNYNNSIDKSGKLTESGFAAEFERQVAFFDRHFQFNDPENFYRSTEKSGKPDLFLTFDDGYLDNYTIAFPTLKKYGVKAAFFIVSDLTDTNNWLDHDKLRYLASEQQLDTVEVEAVLKRMNKGIAIGESFRKRCDQLFDAIPGHRLMMNWKEIGELADAGFIIGSHTHTHAPLLFLDEQDRSYQLEKSIEVIQSKIGRKVNHFAYPNGLLDDKCEAILNQHAIEFAYTTQNGVNHQSDAPLTLKRIGINASDSIGLIILKVLKACTK